MLIICMHALPFPEECTPSTSSEHHDHTEADSPLDRSIARLAEELTFMLKGPISAVQPTTEWFSLVVSTLER